MLPVLLAVLLSRTAAKYRKRVLRPANSFSKNRTTLALVFPRFLGVPYTDFPGRAWGVEIHGQPGITRLPNA